MGAKRFAIAVALAVLCAGGIRAEELQPDDTFNIDFFAEDGSWNANAGFGVTTTSTWSSSEEYGYTPTQFCPDGNWESCICDPGVKFSVPDQPPPAPFDGSTTFTLSNTGTFDQDYINIGPNIETVVFTTTDFNKDDTYTCSSDFFQFCGFKMYEGTLYIEFGDPINPNGITSAAPEPKQYVLLILAAAAIIAARRYRSRTNFTLR